MKILAIETSCDETGVAIVEGIKTQNGFEFRVLANALLSQAALHAEYGGVYPTLAKREHIKNLPVILAQALKEAKPKFDEKIVWGLPEDFFSSNFGETIDAVAVTNGPGLEPALWTGIEFAKKLAQEWQLPLIPANHMEGHLISSLVQGGKLDNIQLPVLGLLISGGHTEFVLMKDWFQYELVGQTLDDAVGECFDKVARMLNLPYPGGPHISKLAEAAREAGKTSAIKLPRPMLHADNCDVSFSGLKTAALYALRDKELNDAEKSHFAREFEDAVTDVFIAKTKRALEETGAQTFVIGGGVAANKHIRIALEGLIAKEFPDVEMRLPELSITGDNAIMIAEAALARSLAGVQQTPPVDEIRAVGNLSL